MFHLAQLDAIEWLKSLPDGSISLLIVDPPYESLEKHRKIGTTTRLKKSKASSCNWFQIFPNSRFAELFKQCFRVLAQDSHMYLFCDAETMFIAKPIAEGEGFKFWKPLIWDKVKIGMGYHYRARCERILFFEKGKRKLNDLSIPDILSFPRVFRGYPTEKPVELMKILVEQSSRALEVVADPFVGSGSSGVASLQTKRSFVGNDISEEALEMTQSRLLLIDSEQKATKADILVQHSSEKGVRSYHNL